MFHVCLPVELSGNLDNSTGERGCDLPETIGTIQTHIPRPRRIEVRMVEGVEGFEAELGSHALPEQPVLLENGVPVLVMGPAKI